MSEPVSLEVGKHRVFATALSWPGWCRAGRDEEGALRALADYAPRYARLAARAELAFSEDPSFEVTERLPGSATTDFGAPGAVATAERAPLEPAAAALRGRLVAASWELFEEVVAGAPAVLRKGPRGGGRDRDAIASHVAAAELAYLRKVGIGPGDDLTAARERLLTMLSGSERPDAPWPLAYGLRRIAWHVLDHAWEIEDKSKPS